MKFWSFGGVSNEGHLGVVFNLIFDGNLGCFCAFSMHLKFGQNEAIFEDFLGGYESPNLWDTLWDKNLKWAKNLSQNSFAKISRFGKFSIFGSKSGPMGQKSGQ